MLSLPALTTAEDINVLGNATMTTFSAPALVSAGNLNFAGNNIQSVIDAMPSLTSLGGFAINAQPGIVAIDDPFPALTSLQTIAIHHIYAVRNPDKLQGVARALSAKTAP